MSSLTPAVLVLQKYGRELSLLRDLLAIAAEDSLKLHAPREHAPKGSTMSGLTRDRFLTLASGSPELLESKVKIRSAGEDWVRIRFPELPREVRLRTRPKSMAKRYDSTLPFNDLLGPPPGHFVLMWTWEAPVGLASFSLVRTVAKDWGPRCDYWEEVPIQEGLVALPLTRPPAGTGNDDDQDLYDLVGRWPSQEARDESEATDDQDEKDDRHDRDSDVGDSG
jgi:hypothetical protein